MGDLVCFDAAPARGQWRWTDKGLEVRVRPFWYGTRRYPTRDGVMLTVLRRRSQVMAPAHLQRFARLTMTDGHPRYPTPEGPRKVFLSAKAEPGTPTPFDPSVLWFPHELYYVGSFGDSWAEVDSPLGRTAEFLATITVKATADKARAGDLEVSTGHLMHYIPASESVIDGEEVVAEGQWKNPVTGRLEAFDVEGLSDPEDPRIPLELREYIGPNHCGATVGAGRGGPGVRILPITGDDAPRVALDEQELLGGLRLIAMQRPAVGPGAAALIIASGGDDDMATMVWLGETPAATTYARLGDLLKRHVDGHPERETILTGLVAAPDAGQSSEVERPSAEAPAEAPPETSDDEDTMADPDYKKMYDDLVAQNANTQAALKAKDEKIAALEQELAAAKASSAEDKKTATDAKSEADKKAEEAKVANDKAGKAQAALDALELETKPLKLRHFEERRTAATRIAAGSKQLDAIKAVAVTADKPYAVALDELETLGVKGYYEAHPDDAPTGLEERLANRSYVGFRFDELAASAGSKPRASTFDSLTPERKPTGTANDSADPADNDDLMARLNPSGRK